MARVRVRYYAGAAKAAGTDAEDVEADTVEALVELIGGKYDKALVPVLAVASFLIDGETIHDRGRLLRDGDVVEVLPPFAGG